MDEERFLLHKDNDKLIFVSNKSMEIMANCEILLIDGTFKSAPVIFKQIFSIHKTYHSYCIPLVFCPLSNRRRKYIKLDKRINSLFDLHNSGDVSSYMIYKY